MTAFDGEHVIFAESSSIQITNRQVDTTSDPVMPLADGLGGKEVCNRRVACSLLKLGSLEKTVRARWRLTSHALYYKIPYDLNHALSPTGYQKRTAQILRVTHFYDLLM